MRRELFALSVLFLLLVVFPLSLFGYQAWRTHAAGVRVIELTASAPDKGDWQPKDLRVQVSEKVRLRIKATDVIHGFVAPGLGLAVDEIAPGHVAEIEFVATQPGRYVFACSRWCSVDHWRMRGVIEVIDPTNPAPVPMSPSTPPLYQQLNIDLDAPHLAAAIPTTRPSAARGDALDIALPSDLHNASSLRRLAPADVFQRLRADPTYGALSDAELWDMVALAWLRVTLDGSLQRGRQLYGRDCAACHGQMGKGDGPAGRNLPGLAAMQAGAKSGPADFTDAGRMLGASDVLLQGKILRGGMGSGMPEWGSLYGETDMQDVIAYIRSFLFDLGPVN